MPLSSTRQKLRGSIENMFRLSQEILSSETKPTDVHLRRQGSKNTTYSSPVDAAYDSSSRTAEPINVEPTNFKSSKSSKQHQKHSELASDQTVLPSLNNNLSLPPIEVTDPEQSKSFFDMDSSSDDEPIIHRASSVRVGKPQIIEHIHVSSAQVPQIHSNGLAPPGFDSSVPEASQSLTSIVDDQHDSVYVYGRPGGPADALRALEGNLRRYPEDDPASGGPADALRALEANATKQVSAENLSPTPPLSTATTQQPKENRFSSASTKVEELSISPTFIDGFRTMRRDNNLHRANSAAPSIDGLRSNPMTETEKVHLSRTISAPVAPNRNPNRRVRIRTSDLFLTHPDNDHTMFKESVVTTPYPGRNLGSSMPEEHEMKSLAKFSKVVPSATEHNVSTPEKDRFPSPTRAEHFVLVLSLAAHPEAKTTIEISMPDPHSTSQPFDDEFLFQQIRQAYNTKLLGVVRRLFSSRMLTYASLTSQATIADLKTLFDSTSFIGHLNNPSHGRKRQDWIQWLRQYQLRYKDARTSTRSNSIQPSPNSNKYPWSSPVSTTRSTRSAHFPLLAGHSNNTMNFPHISLHYSFHPSTIPFAVTLLMILSAVSTILWVLFGVPGLKAGDHRVYPNSSVPSSVNLMNAEYGWKQDAEMRVLTGLVLGVFVFLVGGLGVGAWILGGWVLL